MLTVFLLTSLVVVQPADVKGWNGADWGMSPDRVKAAVGMPLDTLPEASRKGCPIGGKGPMLGAAQPIEVVTVQTRVLFCFSEASELEAVTLDLGSTVAAYNQVRDELKSKYGEPTSEKADSMAGGNVKIRQSKWLLPLTEIHCTAAEFGSSPSMMYVSYLKRKKSVL